MKLYWPAFPRAPATTRSVFHNAYTRIYGCCVLRGDPSYLLRSPDAVETPFTDVLHRYNGFEVARGFNDLCPLIGIAENVQHLELRRLYKGKLTQVLVSPRDPNALRLPLLPGDQITWK